MAISMVSQSSHLPSPTKPIRVNGRVREDETTTTGLQHT